MVIVDNDCLVGIFRQNPESIDFLLIFGRHFVMYFTSYRSVFINLIKESDFCMFRNICNNFQSNSDLNNDFGSGDFQFGASREALTETAL